ncbi:bifunctional (p)ppGpp synthetase/guanosine-3',5'-bis(diphosphate) 3'-pyrophosphohydrolase [Acuticoccus sp. I52.16.1]|uniref:RelA/SpoT family protein n=1 Tax=Acuticoccus sp. I52.16.1 TaxID=2928472 RepID=UPI001FD44A24|nr:bifunctional (p)ppGpp synthetase/guanosine-3',5'-bis(diphosphate) 3'-pyrophosphohydrolase [Acuticoccus sp. I52.16.1]UOM33679.1 bifunctional (p)ppGpp synthetase/guanosine-3',5'-bis(diphosphate) 3'-pyrophosphohydrolase [Acuticoccus sp. I52.16.1]
MMRQYELVERVAAYNPDVDEALLNRAYVYSMTKHGGQKRASGDPYFSHPLEVAAILTQMRLDDATIVAALLHDTIEDTDATRAEIDHLFGPRIGKLVEGLTKIGRLAFVSQADKQGENLRKLLLAVAEDVRVLLVKLADRLHNMRTIHWVPVHKRARIAQETMEVYAPLAGKMGIFWMREELEHLSFHVLHPEEAAYIEGKLAERRAAVGSLLSGIEAELSERLRVNDIAAVVTGREKKPYSIFAKMQRKSINFEHLSDIYGFRILVDTTADCYAALGVVHTIWQSVPGRFKDHISTPKQNGYRSIHTTLVGPRKQRIELQIRSHEMHRLAEYGIAAHAFYKDGTSRRPSELARDSEAYAWLRHTIELLSDGGSSAEFLEHTKLELFQDRVYCFTPRGKLIALPPGATPIDFAYQVHTDVGNTCTGCRINGHPRPLVTPLNSGDEVEILCKEGAQPPSAWNALAVTGKARAAIRRANREQDRRKFVRLGRQLFENEVVRRALPDVPSLATSAERLGYPEADALAYAIGSDAMSATDVLRALGYEAEGTVPPPAHHNGAPVKIRGHGDDLPITFAPQHPTIPGDKIVGILQPGEGVTIYPAGASDALDAVAADPHCWVDVAWDLSGAAATLYTAAVRVVASNKPTVFAGIAEALEAEDADLGELTVVTKTPDYRELNLHIEVRDAAHLSRVLDRLRGLTTVAEASRTSH